MIRPNCPECSRPIVWLPGNEVSAFTAGRVEQANQDIATLRSMAAEVATDARTCDPHGDAIASLTYATHVIEWCAYRVGGGTEPMYAWIAEVVK